MRNATLHRPINHAVTVAVTIGAILAHASAQIPCQYEVTLFTGPDTCGKFFPPPVPSTWGINDAGAIVGKYLDCKFPAEFGFFWSQDTGLQTLAGLNGYVNARAYDLIDADFIVGRMELSGFQHPILWDRGVPQDLGFPQGANNAFARGVNSKRQIAGSWSNNVAGPLGVFLWDQKLIDISDDFSTVNCQAFGINEKSQITGWMGEAPSVDSRAFIWDDGKVIELPHIPGGYTSVGIAINDYGDVVGNGFIAYDNQWGWVRRAYYWSDGKALNLGTLPGCEESFAFDIKNDGTVVGYCVGPDLIAFVWKNGVMRALDDLVPPELELGVNIARSISDSGQIAAHGPDKNLNGVAMLLTPVAPPVGDLNSDCQVGASDVLILLASWGPCDICEDCPADLTGDCVVGAVDLLILLANWG